MPVRWRALKGASRSCDEVVAKREALSAASVAVYDPSIAITGLFSGRGIMTIDLLSFKHVQVIHAAHMVSPTRCFRFCRRRVDSRVAQCLGAGR